MRVLIISFWPRRSLKGASIPLPATGLCCLHCFNNQWDGIGFLSPYKPLLSEVSNVSSLDWSDEMLIEKPQVSSMFISQLRAPCPEEVFAGTSFVLILSAYLGLLYNRWSRLFLLLSSESPIREKPIRKVLCCVAAPKGITGWKAAPLQCREQSSGLICAVTTEKAPQRILSHIPCWGPDSLKAAGDMHSPKHLPSGSHLLPDSKSAQENERDLSRGCSPTIYG